VEEKKKRNNILVNTLGSGSMQQQQDASVPI